MEKKYIDIHSHLNLSPLYEDREGVILRMQQNNTVAVVVGVDFDTSVRNIELAKEFPGVIVGATIGLHPTDNALEVFDVEKYKLLAQHKEVLAIGECGLDYYRLPKNEAEIVEIKEKQKNIFKKQIELALEVQKPLMIHARPSGGTMDAYEDALNMLETYILTLTHEQYRLKCNFHFFVGDVAIAARIVKNGWTVSVDGPITFTDDYNEMIRSVQLENIMAETDAPFAAPAPYRGKTGEPWMVSEVYKKIALIKEIDEEFCRETLNRNAQEYLGISF